MITQTEQLAVAGRAQLDATVRFATIAAEGIEKLLDLQFKNARSSFDDAMRTARAFTELKDVSQVAAWAETGFKPGLDKAGAYAKGVYDVATGTQQEICALLEEQVAVFSKDVSSALDAALKSAPPGSESAVAAARSVLDIANSVYDTVAKANKKLASLAESKTAVATGKTKVS